MNNKNKKYFVRMEDIAKAAGVSKSAVSKALNNKPDISEKMRAHIFQICEQMGYQINFRIQDMIRERQTGMTHNIAFITVGIEISNPAYVRALDGIARGVDENDLRLLLEQLDGTEKSLYDLPPILRDARIDGFIVTGILNKQIISVLRQLNIPYIILGTYDNDIIKNSINLCPDIETGIQEIIQLLKKEGHKKIAYFTETKESFFERKLITLFESTLKLHNLAFNANLVYHSTGKYTGAYNIMQNIFEKEHLPFDGIICPDFRTAMQISHLAFAHSKKYSQKSITIATRKLLPYYDFPIKTIYYDSLLPQIAYEGVISLVNIITGKNKIQTKKILISPEITSNDPCPEYLP